MNRFPEYCDLVAVINRKEQVEYYGYVIDIDYDMRHPAIKVEFWQGCSQWFDFADIKMVKYPEELK